VARHSRGIIPPQPEALEEKLSACLLQRHIETWQLSTCSGEDLAQALADNHFLAGLQGQ